VLNLLAVGCGGFVGATVRYGVSRLFTVIGPTVFPWGTLIVNIIAAFCIGLVMGAVPQARFLDDRWVLAINVGLLGALSTFSAFSIETWRLFQEGAYAAAVLNIGANVVLALAFTGFGLWLAR
jgi:CrcB protein